MHAPPPFPSPEVDRLEAALRRHALVARLDAAGRLLEANQALAELTGRAIPPHLGRAFRRFTGAPRPRALRHRIRETMALAGSCREALPVSTASGARRWVDLILLREATGLLALGHDATEAREQAEALAKLGRLYEALGQVGRLLRPGATQADLFQGACEALVDLAGFKMVWIGLDDPATHEVHVAAAHGDTEGYLRRIRVRSDDTPEGRGPGGLAIRTGRPVVQNDFLHAAATAPWHAAARRAGLRSNATFPLRRSGRSIGHISLYSSEPGFFGEAEVELMGKVAHQLSYALDHLEEEAARAKAEERFALLFDAIPAPTSLLRLSDRTYVEVNAAFQRVLGYRAEEVLGRTGEALGLWAEPDRRARYLENLKHHPGAQAWTTALRTRDGREIQVLYSGELLELRGEMFVLSIFLDVTQARRMEAERNQLRAQLFQSQKLEALGLLAGGLGHDLNNKLGAILAHAELLERKLPADSPLLNHVTQTVRAVDQAQGLVHHLLAISRKLPATPERLDLNAHLQGIVQTLAPLLGVRVRIEWTGAPDLPPVTFDPGLLEQVVMNLVLNARDALPRGGRITLTTRLVPSAEVGAIPALRHRDRPHVCLTCQDTGVGMDEETLSRIFEPFFTTKAPGLGSGLGLSTAFGIVEQAEGTLLAESRPGEGATFRVYLPAAPAADAPPSPEETSLPSLRVMLVDDDEGFRQALAEGLRMHGHQVVALGSPEQALTAFEGAPDTIDLLIADLVMPGTSGLDLLQALRAQRPGLQAILLSGYTPDLLEARLRLGPGVQFLQKPFSSNALWRLMAKAASLRHAGA